MLVVYGLAQSESTIADGPQIINSPAKLWQGYDPESLPLDQTSIKTWTDHDGSFESLRSSAVFSTVEEYVRHLLEADAGPLEQSTVNGGELSETEWQPRFRELLSVLESGNPRFDDSRASIYQLR